VGRTLARQLKRANVQTLMPGKDELRETAGHKRWPSKPFLAHSVHLGILIASSIRLRGNQA
jgi:hypothetical protein